MTTPAAEGASQAAALIPDEWLGERLGVPAFSLPDRADPLQQAAVRPAFVQAKVRLEDRPRLEALIRTGYALIETAVTLECDIGQVSRPSSPVRFARPADEAAVRGIAATAFQYSRFHADPLIASATANRIKADWAGNFFKGGRGTHMVVATEREEPAGFMLLIHRSERLIIDLVGVAPAFQGRGLGRAMLDFAAGEVSGPTRFVVGTQLQNVGSLAYYTGYGFRVSRSNYTLHRHC